MSQGPGRNCSEKTGSDELFSFGGIFFVGGGPPLIDDTHTHTYFQQEEGLLL